MTKIVDEYVFSGDSSGAEEAARKVKNAAKDAFDSAAKGAVVFNKALDLAIEASKKLAGELAAGAKDAMERERTTIAMKASLEAFGHEVERTSALLDAHANRIESLTGVSDEAVRSLQTMAIQYGVSADRVDDLVEASIALSNVTKRDVQTSFDALMRSQNGTLDRTLAMIPAFRDLTKEQLAAGEAVDLVNQRFGKFLGLAHEGTAGAFAQLGLAWGNMRESIAAAALGIGVVESETRKLARAIEDLTIIGEEEGFFASITALVGGTFMKPTVSSWADTLRARREAEEQIARTAQRRKALEADMTSGAVGGVLTFGEEEGLVTSAAKPKARASGGGPADISSVSMAGLLGDTDAEMFAARSQNDIGRSIDIAQELAAADVEVAKARAEQLAEVEQGRQSIMLDLQRQTEEGMSEIAATNSQRRIDLATYETGRLQELHEMAGRTMVGALQSASAVGIQALVDLASGAEVSGEKVAAALISSVGNTLIAQGQWHFFTGLAGSLWPGAGNPALMGVGAAEIAAGVAFAAAGKAVSGDRSSRFAPTPTAGASGGGGGHGASGFVGGSSGSFGDSKPRREEPRVTIVVEGWMSAEEVGRRTRRAMEEAARLGV